MNEKGFCFGKRAPKCDVGFEGKIFGKFYNLLLSHLKLTQGERVLDVGCGTGTLLRSMADYYGIVGYGIDIKENMLAEALKKCPEMDIRLSKCEAMPFDSETLDTLTTCMAYYHFSNKN